MKYFLPILLLLAAPVFAGPVSPLEVHHWYSPMKSKWFWVENGIQVGMYIGMAVNSSQPCRGCGEASPFGAYGERPISTGRVLAIGIPANLALMGLNLAAWDVAAKTPSKRWSLLGRIEVPIITSSLWGGTIIHDTLVRQCIDSRLTGC
jgi:hypothetical protein